MHSRVRLIRFPFVSLFYFSFALPFVEPSLSFLPFFLRLRRNQRCLPPSLFTRGGEKKREENSFFFFLTKTYTQCRWFLVAKIFFLFYFAFYFLFSSFLVVPFSFTLPYPINTKRIKSVAMKTSGLRERVTRVKLCFSLKNARSNVSFQLYAVSLVALYLA